MTQIFSNCYLFAFTVVDVVCDLLFVVAKESVIIVLAADSTGRFILSADKSGIINVWDVSIARQANVQLCCNFLIFVFIMQRVSSSTSNDL